MRVSRNEFNKIKDHIMSLNDNQSITRTYDKQFDFNITKELIKEIASNKITKNDAINELRKMISLVLM